MFNLKMSSNINESVNAKKIVIACEMNLTRFLCTTHALSK